MLYVQAPQEGSYYLVQRLCCCGLCALNLAAGDVKCRSPPLWLKPMACYLRRYQGGNNFWESWSVVCGQVETSSSPDRSAEAGM